MVDGLTPPFLLTGPHHPHHIDVTDTDRRRSASGSSSASTSSLSRRTSALVRATVWYGVRVRFGGEGVGDLCRLIDYSWGAPKQSTNVIDPPPFPNTQAVIVLNTTSRGWAHIQSADPLYQPLVTARTLNTPVDRGNWWYIMRVRVRVRVCSGAGRV